MEEKRVIVLHCTEKNYEENLRHLVNYYLEQFANKGVGPQLVVDILNTHTKSIGILSEQILKDTLPVEQRRNFIDQVEKGTVVQCNTLRSMFIQ